MYLDALDLPKYTRVEVKGNRLSAVRPSIQVSKASPIDQQSLEKSKLFGFRCASQWDTFPTLGPYYYYYPMSSNHTTHTTHTTSTTLTTHTNHTTCTNCTSYTSKSIQTSQTTKLPNYPNKAICDWTDPHLMEQAKFTADRPKMLENSWKYLKHLKILDNTWKYLKILENTWKYLKILDNT